MKLVNDDVVCLDLLLLVFAGMRYSAEYEIDVAFVLLHFLLRGTQAQGHTLV